MKMFSRLLVRSWVLALLAVLGGTASLRAQVKTTPLTQASASSPSGLWQETDEKALLAKRGSVSTQTVRNGVIPSQYRTLHLDFARLGTLLEAAPEENVTRKALALGAPAEVLPAPVEIDLPIPHSAAFARFTVESSSIMEPGLATRYPGLRTYVVQGIDNPELSGRIDQTIFGFHALVFSPGGQIVIDPYFADGSDPTTAIAFYKRDYTTTRSWTCGVHSPPQSAARMAGNSALPIETNATGGTLNVYRLVVGTTGEYSAAVGGGDVTATLAAVVTTINRVDALYEREFAIRMVLVAKEDQMIFTNASTDPYTNDDPDSLLSENQTKCDSVIGTLNYDIGHVFSTAGGGLADLGAVCQTSYKAQGETGTTSPTGDPYDIDYVAHEMGHQFGANHTFNGSTGSCGGGNRNTGTAYEPASGVTIMAYAGICSAAASNIQDLALDSDDFFATASYGEIITYQATASGKNTAPTTVSTGNTAPAITTPTAYTIPLNTPFALTASASDVNGDRLTYCWEEYDLGAAVDATTVATLDNGASPIFRPFPPTTNPTRTFPALAYILANNGTTNNAPPLRGSDGFLVGETLPAKARTAGLNFRCTVRDNRAGGGGSNYAAVKLTVASAAGPFAVTAPNTAVSYAAGASVPVTWNVASTSATPVSCANVKISLSTDGGLTFPYVLASSVANSGTATVVLPNTANVVTTQARIKVEAVGNIFFDIGNVNFAITSTTGTTAPTFSANTTGLAIVRGTPAAVAATVGTVAAGTSAVTGVTVSGLPDGASVTGSLSGSNVVLTGTAECRLTTTLTTRNYPISVTVTDQAGATSSATVNLVIKPNLNPTVGTYAAVSIPAGTSTTVTPSAAPADSNGNLAPAPLSVSPTTPLPTGMTATFNQTTGALTLATTSTTAQATTTLRVQVLDTCGAAYERTVAVTVAAPPTTSAPVFSSAAPSGAATAGAAYSYTFTASGTPKPTYAVTGGTLPPGLSLNGTMGVLSGTPTTPGVYGGIQVTASNGTAPNAAQTFFLKVVNTQGNYAASYGLTGANAAPGADPDSDGLSNLLEYALNLNPTASDAGSAATPQAQVAVRPYNGGSYLSIRFTRVPLATDVTYIVEASPDLASWTAVATGSGGAALSGPGVVIDDASTTTAHTVEVRDTVAQTGAADQRRFLRLRVTQP